MTGPIQPTRPAPAQNPAAPPRPPGTVADLMKEVVYTISPDASILDLIRTLRERDIGGMPVTDAAGRVVGTVSSADVLWLADSVAAANGAVGFLPSAELVRRKVRDIMTPDVFGVAPDASLADLRRFFARTGVQRALVLDQGAVVGIVTLSDVLATLAP